MDYYKLCDVCDFQGGTQPPKDEWSFELKTGYIRMLQIRDFTQSEKTVPEYIKITNATKICDKDDILIARYGASLGKILTGLSGAYNVAIMKTIPNTEKLNKKYLYYYLKSPVFQRFLLNVGSRAAQAGFNKNDLKDLLIPNVSKKQQERIVEILVRIERVISLRKQQLAKLDELVKARFVEMFGQITDKKKLEEFTVLITKGASPKWQGVDYCDEGVLFITSENVREGYIDYSKQKFLPDTINRIQPRSKLQRNDILINIVNASIGRAALFESDISANINQAVALVRVKPEIINYKYLLTFLNSDAAHRIYDSMKVGGDKANLSLKNISELFIPNVRIDVQNEFAAFTEQVDKSKVAVQKALDEAQTLFDSLMQQYFG